MKTIVKNATISFLLLLLAPAGYLSAQKRSTISIHSSAYNCLTNIPEASNQGFSADQLLSLMGIAYQYHLPHGFSVVANYSFTEPTWLSLNGQERLMSAPIFAYPASGLEERIKAMKNGYYSDPHGFLDTYLNYNFFDLGGSYRYVITSRQKLSFSLGLSYAYGKNDYITMLSAFGDVGYEKDVTRWKGNCGVFAGLSYDYMLWKNRINVGIEATLRKYEGNFPLFISYGFHAGYNF